MSIDINRPIKSININDIDFYRLTTSGVDKLYLNSPPAQTQQPLFRFNCSEKTGLLKERNKNCEKAPEGVENKSGKPLGWNFGVFLDVRTELNIIRLSVSS